MLLAVHQQFWQKEAIPLYLPSRMLRLPTMLLAAEGWRPSLLRAVAVVRSYSAAALEAVVVVSRCNDILLGVALALTDSLSVYLSAMLRLNALFRLALAGALFSRERRQVSSRTTTTTTTTWASARTRGSLRRRFEAALHVVAALSRRSLSACRSVQILVLDSRPGLSSVCGCIRQLLSTVQTVTAYSPSVLGIVWDLSSLTSRP